MKIEVVSGQPGVNIDQFFEDLLKKKSYDICGLQQEHFITYPELYFRHPKVIFNAIRERVAFHIESESDLFLLTYSDHTLNAVRVEIKKHNFAGGIVHQILTTGEDMISEITPDGRLTLWAKDVFEVWDQALYELI